MCVCVKEGGQTDHRHRERKREREGHADRDKTDQQRAIKSHRDRQIRGKKRQGREINISMDTEREGKETNTRDYDEQAQVIQ